MNIIQKYVFTLYANPSTNTFIKLHSKTDITFFRLLLAFYAFLTYNLFVVIPLITSLISNPNTPFNRRGLSRSLLFFCIQILVPPCYNTSMKHLTIDFKETMYSSSILDFYFGGMTAGVLDIETTGLNPSRNKFILGGLYNKDEETVHQLFAEKRADEANALAAYLDEIYKMDMLITYNGKHFDMPFIEKRAAVHGLDVKPMPYNLDLYLVLNGHSPVKRFVPNLKQKTIENYMGLWVNRKDEISGGESVELYDQYEKSGDPELEKVILLHNSDDIMQLTRLLKIVSKCDFHRAMYHLGFPAGPLNITKIRVERDHLFIQGIQRKISMDYMGYFWNNQPVESRFISADNTFFFKLPIIRQSGLVIADLDALGLDTEDFGKYPSYNSGFLVLEQESQRNHMEINHLIRDFIRLFIKREGI